jgi:hypothetical protein
MTVMPVLVGVEEVGGGRECTFFRPCATRRPDVPGVLVSFNRYDTRICVPAPTMSTWSFLGDSVAIVQVWVLRKSARS